MQVVCSAFRIGAGPQDVCDLLPVQTVPRRERQELDEARRLLEAPPVSFDGPCPDRQRKAAEQPDADRLPSHPGIIVGHKSLMRHPTIISLEGEDCTY